MTEYFIISDDPDIPIGNKNHFSEERLPKPSSSMDKQISRGITRRPINLQIIPYSDTETAIEKKDGLWFP